jgi:hypothetical protein
VNKSSALSILTTAAAAAAAAMLLLAAASAQAQNFDLLIQQQMQAMNANIARGQQMVNQAVQQRMHDPQVQAAYRQYVARSGGRPAMDYPTFTYNWIYTAGFSAGGIEHARATEAGIQSRERAAVQGLREAEAARGRAQQAQRDGWFRNQQEAGRQLMGNNTYVAPNGAPMVLPHTWQRDTIHDYQGQRYRVDASGQYFVLGANGWWYPLAPGR